jgi:hypothetical protein
MPAVARAQLPAGSFQFRLAARPGGNRRHASFDVRRVGVAIGLDWVTPSRCARPRGATKKIPGPIPEERRVAGTRTESADP